MGVLGYYDLANGVNVVTVDKGHFVPEVDRNLIITGGTGTSIVYHGTDSSGGSLSNGYYLVELIKGDGSSREAGFYLEHQAWPGGSVQAILPFKASFALLRWNYSEPVVIHFDIYNLAGELVWQMSGSGQSGQARWELVSASNQAISGGVYLVKAHAVSVDGAVEDIQVLKLAVVR